MEKSIALLALLALSVMANAASAASTCESQASRVKASERTGFLKSCLDRMGSPENVRQAVLHKKRLSCERNAKNLSLRDESRNKYVGACIEKNEAALARAESGKRVFRISREQLAAFFTGKSAQTANAPQKSPMRKVSAKPGIRQANPAICKDS